MRIMNSGNRGINDKASTPQYDSAGTMTLSYFMVTDDYTGYRSSKRPDL